MAHELTHHGQALDPTMVAKIEAATRPTNVAEVTALSRVLRVAPSVLLEGQDLTDAEARWIVVEAEASKLMQRREQLGLEIGNVDAKLSRLAAQKAQLQTQVREERERGQ